MGTYHVNTQRLEATIRGESAVFFAIFGNRVLTNASERCNVDTGLLRASLYMDLILGGKGCRVGARTSYARWVHDGRGWVYPKTKKVLRWIPKGGGAPIFARRSRPYAGNPFLLLAMHEEASRV